MPEKKENFIGERLIDFYGPVKMKMIEAPPRDPPQTRQNVCLYSNNLINKAWQRTL